MGCGGGGEAVVWEGLWVKEERVITWGRGLGVRGDAGSRGRGAAGEDSDLGDRCRRGMQGLGGSLDTSGVCNLGLTCSKGCRGFGYRGGGSGVGGGGFQVQALASRHLA